MLILTTIVIYIALLFTYSHVMAGKGSNSAFFRADNGSPWWVVAFGMVGASISGVTFVSVPGMVNSIGMSYMQTCLGFIVGYAIVAFVLLPVYYRMNSSTIYSFLRRRLGDDAHKAGAWFFLLSKMTGAAVRFFVVTTILQRYVFDAIGIPYVITAPLLVLLIWLYTRRGGIKSIVWTDSLQTLCMLVALSLIIYKVAEALDVSLSGAFQAVMADERSQWFVFDDVLSKQYFWKQFLSGIFIVIVMTGLDQDMMQKNLTCKSLRDAQKDMCSYGILFVPVNFLFLSLGILLSLLCERQGIEIPLGDALLPSFAASGYLGEAVVVFFTIGVVAAAFSSADSALTSMTTSYCVDIKGNADDEGYRKKVHAVIAIAFTLIIFAVREMNSSSVIDAIYTLCGYTYGPLLGLFAFAMVNRGKRNVSHIPVITVLSPLICWLLDTLALEFWNYKFGYELLMINGTLTFLGLTLCRKRG